MIINKVKAKLNIATNIDRVTHINVQVKVIKLMSVSTISFTCLYVVLAYIFYLPISFTCLYILLVYIFYLPIFFTCLYFLLAYIFTCLYFLLAYIFYLPIFFTCLYLLLAYIFYLPIFFICLYFCKQTTAVDITINKMYNNRMCWSVIYKSSLRSVTEVDDHTPSVYHGPGHVFKLNSSLLLG